MYRREGPTSWQKPHFRDIRDVQRRGFIWEVVFGHFTAFLSKLLKQALKHPLRVTFCSFLLLGTVMRVQNDDPRPRPQDPQNCHIPAVPHLHMYSSGRYMRWEAAGYTYLGSWEAYIVPLCGMQGTPGGYSLPCSSLGTRPCSSLGTRPCSLPAVPGYTALLSSCCSRVHGPAPPAVIHGVEGPAPAVIHGVEGPAPAIYTGLESLLLYTPG